jgi:hypothetical protein
MQISLKRSKKKKDLSVRFKKTLFLMLKAAFHKEDLTVMSIYAKQKNSRM